MNMRANAFAALIAVLPLAGGCPPESAGPPEDAGGPSGQGLSIQAFIDGASFPAAIAIAPDGRLFYTEKQTGRIRVVAADGQLLPDPFAVVPASTATERGLLGITLHPDFAANGLVYVYYTRSASGTVTNDPLDVLDNRVVRFAADGNVAGSPEELIIALPALPGPIHNGGQLAFGPDGKLYIVIGELGVSQNAQDPANPTGKVLRVNDDGSIPADNPFGSSNPVFALGIRNSFGITFDPVSGRAFETENGTNRDDEVNIIVAGGNYGWPTVLGIAGDARFIDPIVDFGQGSVVPTGIAFFPNNAFGPGTQGQFLVAQYETGRIIRFALNASRDAVAEQAVFAQGIPGGMTSLAFAPDGTLYVSTSSQVLHIVPAGG